MVKTFEDMLKDVKEDELLAIGSESAFFFFGTKDEVIANCQKIDSVNHKELKERYDKCKKTVATRKKDLEKAKEKLQTAIISMERNRNALEAFRPLLDREVEEVNESITDGGLRIKLEGAERGNYWSKEEWDKSEENQG